MPTPIPTDLIDGYSYVASGGTVGANSIVIALSSLTGVDAAAANATTGDGRKVVAALAKNMATKFTALGTKPTKLTVTAQSNTQTGAHKDTYTFSVTRDITIGDVSAEA